MEDYNNYSPNNDPSEYNPSFYQQKSNKIWLLFLIPIFIIIVGVIIFLFVNQSQKTISEDKFSQGTSFQLKENKEVKFILNNEEHTLKIDSIRNNSVNLIIQSNPIKVNIKIGEEKKFDLDDDGFFDMQVELKNIIDGVPGIYIKKIHESTCVENWNCGKWSSCSKQANQTRICTDLNFCGTTKNKFPTTQNCTYVQTCIKNWKCSDWNPCINGQKTRNCTDLNSCNISQSKPNEQQSCTSQTLNCGSNTLSQKTQGNQSNFDCFINASKNCNLAKLLNTVSMEIFGISSTSTTYMELKGIESDKCIYYQKTESNSVKFTNEIIQQMLNSGTTQEEINQQEKIANDSAQKIVGLGQTCKFENNNLKVMLERWKKGNFNGGISCNLNINGTSNCTYTGDFENAGCVTS